MVTRIGVDMDGVLIHNDPTWKEYYDSNFHAHNHRELHVGAPPTWDYIYDLCPTCFSEVVNSPTILAQSVPMPGVRSGVRRLSRLRDDNGDRVELWLVSHREPELTEVATSVIERFGVLRYFTSLQWSWCPKLETCRRDKISILIDDAPKNILSLQGTEVTPVIMNWPYNSNLKGLRAYSWNDVVSICSGLVRRKGVVAA